MATKAIMRQFRISNLKNGYEMNTAAGGGARFMPHQSFASSATINASHYHHHGQSNRFSGLLRADFAPIWMVMGLITGAVCIGVHTAKQQLLHSPTVLINKKRREGSPEVNDPQSLISEAEKFINKSFLRKVGHIQANHNINHTDPAIRPNPYSKSA